MALFSRQLIAFMAVAEELHFGRAAQKLHMSQPPLSQQVRLFEERVGVPLIERSTRTVRLTAAGAALRDALKRLMDDGDAALTAARRVAVGEAGSLRIGFTPTGAYRLVPDAVGMYRQDHPGVHLAMIEGDTASLLDLLRSDRLDIAVTRWHDTIDADELRMDAVDTEPLVVAVPGNHALAGRDHVDIAELAGLPLIGFVRARSEYFHALLHQLFSDNGVMPNIVMESLLPTLLTPVAAGVGVAVVPASISELRPNGVRYLPLRARVLPRSTLYVAYRANGLNPAVPDLKRALMAVGVV
ncbi:MULTISPECIES: LysR substrate-binding domain-containing protein [unclassified Achromobacter]|uniref:LysR substrate-binding domain-containing protein n=1 Tax=unclassified Achromobacter TaxID=2626865 RepID=UPI000B51BFE1|nr:MULTISPECIES: LysR substrate-binding domain-containing protein [unclassified Achromobacter]OWT76942.1 LysR family transcriptional regulator [Achromobacter sp. HZ28]OWT77822.1 LysR family transcriptional regulator [Achromobacter sp. HZ34]